MEGIVTPEAVVLDVETAGVASRVFAGMIDLVIQVAILFAGAIVLTMFGFVGSSTRLLVTLLMALVLMGYPLISEALMRGRTIGKRAMGLRAVTVEGAPIRLRHRLLVPLHCPLHLLCSTLPAAQRCAAQSQCVGHHRHR